MKRCHQRGCCAGHEVLAAMSVGVGVRKKWITHMSPVAARDAPRTHWHLRCHLVGSQVVLSYMHKVPPQMLLASPPQMLP